MAFIHALSLISTDFLKIGQDSKILLLLVMCCQITNQGAEDMRRGMFSERPTFTEFRNTVLTMVLFSLLRDWIEILFIILSDNYFGKLSIIFWGIFHQEINFNVECPLWNSENISEMFRKGSLKP